jgi:hypothetical protein
MKIGYLERLAGISNRPAREPEDTQKELEKELLGVKKMNTAKDVIIDNGEERGPGSGFIGKELFSRDELSLIMDLEDEVGRVNCFERIYPRPSTCSYYYSFMEIKRYANALYCTWYCTPKKIRAKLLANNQTYYGEENK